MRSDSSDEAPEEVTFNDSKLATKLAEKKRKQAEQEQIKQTKQKRRERDQRLKEQQQHTHKRKLLSEILKESAADEASGDEGEAAGLDTSDAKAIAQSVGKKKTFEERDGLRVEILDANARVTKKKRLPPAATDAIKKRDQFLFRESVPRR